MIRVLFFARLREDLGQAELELPFSADIASVGSLQQHLQARGETWEDVLAADNILCAVNQQQASCDQSLADGDEVAYFPPVTGG